MTIPDAPAAPVLTVHFFTEELGEGFVSNIPQDVFRLLVRRLSTCHSCREKIAEAWADGWAGATCDCCGQAGDIPARAIIAELGLSPAGGQETKALPSGAVIREPLPAATADEARSFIKGGQLLIDHTAGGRIACAFCAVMRFLWGQCPHEKGE